MPIYLMGAGMTYLSELKKRRLELTQQIIALEARVAELDQAIEMFKAQRRPDVMGTINGLLEEAVPDGLSVEEIVNKSGLNKGSVAVTLSRLKTDGVLKYVNGKYKLP